jgi:hypothetical protein
MAKLVFLVLVLAAGAFMFDAWYARDRHVRPRRTRREWLMRGVMVGLWAAAVVAVPVFGNDRSQPVLATFVDVAILLAILQGGRDLRARRAQT